MRCEEVQDRLEEYCDNRLPELMRRKISHHLGMCNSCRSEYEVISESGAWLQSDREQYASVSMTKSIVEAVMARIMSEEKWAIPIGKKVFTLTARMRRIGVSAAIILLFLCSFTLYTKTDNHDVFAAAMVSPTISHEVVSASEDKEMSPAQPHENIGLDEVEQGPTELAASPTSNIPLNHGIPVNEDKSSHNYSLILSLFGIVVTVITMSWMSRA